MLTKKEKSVIKDNIYSSITEIEEELKKRRNNKILQDKVINFFGENYINEFTHEPRGVLARSIITPNLEFDYFIDLVNNFFRIKPLLFEYKSKFVAKNPEKYYLCKLFFRGFLGKKNCINYETFRVVDFNKNEGKNFNDIETVFGLPLVDLHHNLLESRYYGLSKSIIDITEWFNKTRRSGTPQYYFSFLSLFVYNGVLFENFFIEDEEEAKFIKNCLLDSFYSVSDYFGVRPLIFPLLPLENEKIRSYYSYDENIKNALLNIKKRFESEQSKS